MDSPSKFIRSLPQKDRERILEIIFQLRKGKTDGLDLKKLKGYDALFRVRIGKYRIICEQQKEYGFIVVKVTRRDDTTYNL
ncbi:MAG: hypothetical protein A2836_03135 [Candidatus Taylorbacteria bacterium RIFCSPHIGHO2_01_FULL_45_63]|uniref:Plasmid stabilization protein n=1 Tax=Candidatus Taylorbacteria bacterium RIFCSPHIGHO2_02_FULL_45_35 TaxID=1802311 RepID=A0A1G2MSJ9_9BACT|nr:MAG: hypothetical protein A2836_03135 [Candidatus Taylorbacteria bacterium RIFCSPHIGHO2_01_FULL_45_63]OHA26876.1 MAG: hypothetical protein A3D56_04225 [Candidatus Taylorbacteria bacterium RIFCSPHIGHO2_02_FULL_45_35]